MASNAGASQHLGENHTRGATISSRLVQLAADARARRRPKPEPSPFAQARATEVGYARQMRKIARHVDDIVRGIVPRDAEEIPQPVANRIIEMLNRYAAMLDPWANAVAERVIAEVGSRDYRAWQRAAGKMGRALREEIQNAPTGQLLQAALAEQVHLIKSLPIEAAQRVHELTLEGLTTGRRAKDIADEIMRTGEVTRSRANLIARTEIGRTAEALTEARATSIGSPGYYWQDAGDADVRPEHRRLNGRFIPWNQPPIAGPKGQRYHAGAGPNCRCTQRVVLPPRFQVRS